MAAVVSLMCARGEAVTGAENPGCSPVLTQNPQLWDCGAIAGYKWSPISALSGMEKPTEYQPDTVLLYYLFSLLLCSASVSSSQASRDILPGRERALPQHSPGKAAPAGSDLPKLQGASFPKGEGLRNWQVLNPRGAWQLG